ncbi:MAG: profilin family protein [Candidatus Lokiarchaeota archaeon]|jgi:predicted regulator of Ras-like GTPase activity (Roadblock/LC7/MglB family)
MSSDVEAIINELLNEEQNVFGVAIIDKSGNLIIQTENWDITGDLEDVNKLLNTKLELGQKGMTSLTIQGIKYMMVENTEERKIGTNLTGKGHIIIAPIPIGGTGALVCYINPQITPRDALFSVQNYALKLQGFI